LIDKLIYTYWTNNGKYYDCGFPDFNTFIKFFKISLRKSEEFYDNVIIYCDQKGADKLQENGITTDIIVVDYNSYDFDKRFWNFPKLITYSLQDEPFLHIDTDVILTDKISHNSDIITEKIRPYELTTGFHKFIKYHMNQSLRRYNEIICSGLLGGTNTQIFKDLYNISKDIVTKNMENVEFDNLLIIEELVLTYLAKSQKLTIIQAGNNSKTPYLHFQGSHKEKLINDEYNFIYLESL
jgi:hypothetical protein